MGRPFVTYMQSSEYNVFFNASGKHVREIYIPLNPTFFIVKLGFAGVYLFFLFLLQNIDCGYSLEPPRRYKKNIKTFQLKIFNF